MKYRKKPVVIEAVQLKPDTVAAAYRFIHGPDSVDLRSSASADRWSDYEGTVIASGLRLKTMESDGQTQVAKMGDFIIKGVKGEFYPCDSEVFALTYEAADAPDAEPLKRVRFDGGRPVEWDCVKDGTYQFAGAVKS